MTAVVDANVLIDALRRRPEAVRLLASLDREGDELWSSTLVRIEILGAMRPGEAEATRAMLDLVTWLPVTREIADAAASYSARYRRSHAAIDVTDYVLAATADHLNARLVTRNVKHFPMFEGLAAPY